MSIIRSIDAAGRDCTNVQPDRATVETVQDLKKRGHTNIHDAETGEKYPDTISEDIQRRKNAASGARLVNITI